jgi:beta-lactamase class A
VLGNAVAAALSDHPRPNWGLDLRDADTGEVLAQVNSDRVMDIASVGKLLLLADVADGLSSGRYVAQEQLSRFSVDPMGDSGLWQYLTDMHTLSMQDAAVLVGAVSDNLATNALIARLGLEVTDHMAQRLGLGTTRLHDSVRDVRTSLDARTLSSSSARDLADLARHIHGAGHVLSSDTCSLVRQWLRVGVDLSMVASALALDPLAHISADHGLLMWNKTGTDSGVRADVGVVSGPARSIAYAVVANWSGGDMRDSALAAMREIGTAIRNAVTR